MKHSILLAVLLSLSVTAGTFFAFDVFADGTAETATEATETVCPDVTETKHETGATETETLLADFEKNSVDYNLQTTEENRDNVSQVEILPPQEMSLTNTPTKRRDTPTEDESAQTETVGVSEEALPEDMDEAGYYQYVTWREIEMLACLVDREIGSGLRCEKEAIVWEVLNRIDSTDYDFRNINTVTAALTQRNQYWSSYGVGCRESIDIVTEVLTMWCMEKESGYPIDGRCLPHGYCWHSGDYVAHNYFRDNCYAPYIVWDWSWGWY